MPETESECIPDLLIAFSEWAFANGVRDNRTPTKCSHGPEVPPFGIYLEFNGWPAGVVTPGGGCIAAGGVANEAAALGTR